jgi:hypothetical protein
MELASVLAGERWSDHPRCTHPLLAALAREVNDVTSDGDRQQLVGLVPTVVGRTGDEQTYLRVAVAVATSVIRDVPEETQHVLAGGLLQAERMCGEDPALADVRRQASSALDSVPGAVRWVERLGVRSRITSRMFARNCAPTMVRCAVHGVAVGSPGDGARLRALLETGIAACSRPADRQPASTPLADAPGPGASVPAPPGTTGPVSSASSSST